jgi:hypothetical protein
MNKSPFIDAKGIDFAESLQRLPQTRILSSLNSILFFQLLIMVCLGSFDLQEKFFEK